MLTHALTGSHAILLASRAVVICETSPSPGFLLSLAPLKRIRPVPRCRCSFCSSAPVFDTSLQHASVIGHHHPAYDIPLYCFKKPGSRRSACCTGSPCRAQGYGVSGSIEPSVSTSTGALLAELAFLSFTLANEVCPKGQTALFAPTTPGTRGATTRDVIPGCACVLAHPLVQDARILDTHALRCSFALSQKGSYSQSPWKGV
ncbi:uncharacterized protein LOC62_07G009551 [Vanrija pseudolonga]|uniref:Uncharacterized protein n=1 Tax=Vanrija pseudolonga TaxID=143232 RepID=A0AAF0YL24_9TREE|nr:hypothetical protein LOC62_07G009551 [Vanrija pseudolonga]WOO86065.1 hypothetical protein LOC62_07G009551 [Vanrija pseudolonga]